MHPVEPLFRRLALLVSHTLIFEGEIVLLTFVIYFDGVSFNSFRCPRGLFPLTLHTYYSTSCAVCQEVFQIFFEKFSITLDMPIFIENLGWASLLPLDCIYNNILSEKSQQFSKNNLVIRITYNLQDLKRPQLSLESIQKGGNI